MERTWFRITAATRSVTLQTAKAQEDASVINPLTPSKPALPA